MLPLVVIGLLLAAVAPFDRIVDYMYMVKCRYTAIAINNTACSAFLKEQVRINMNPNSNAEVLALPQGTGFFLQRVNSIEPEDIKALTPELDCANPEDQVKVLTIDHWDSARK